jgi:hypothetical protein
MIAPRMGIEIFRHDDVGYERWLRSHRDSFVVSARQRITPGFLQLHRAWCDSITILQPGAPMWTRGEYVKVCASDRAMLSAGRLTRSAARSTAAAIA